MPKWENRQFARRNTGGGTVQIVFELLNAHIASRGWEYWICRMGRLLKVQPR